MKSYCALVSMHRLLHPRSLLQNHLHTILQAHLLEGLFPLKVIFLINLMKILDLFAPFILFSEVAEITFDLNVALLHTSSDLQGLFFQLLIFHFFDLKKTLAVWYLVWIDRCRPNRFLYLISLSFNLLNFIAVI